MSIESLGSVTISVAPERLKTQAAEASRRLRRMERLFEDVEAVICRTGSYWIGEGGDLHRQAYLERKDELAAMLARLEEHPRDLLMISGNYEEAEADILSAIEQLRTDVIDY